MAQVCRRGEGTGLSESLDGRDGPRILPEQGEARCPSTREPVPVRCLACTESCLHGCVACAHGTLLARVAVSLRPCHERACLAFATRASAQTDTP